MPRGGVRKDAVFNQFIQPKETCKVGAKTTTMTLIDLGKLTDSVSVRLTRKDADLLKADAEKHGFETMGAYVRAVVLNNLSVPNERSSLLETLLRVEFLVAECFKTFAPDPQDRAQVERLQERAEAVSRELLKSFVSKRVEASNDGGINGGI